MKHFFEICEVILVNDYEYSSYVEKLETASAAWLRDLEEHGASPSTITGYALTAEDFTRFFASEEDEPDVPSYADVFLWAQTFDCRGITLRTQRQYLIRLRAFFNWAVEHGWYATNPVLDRLIPSTSDLPPAGRVALHDWQLQRLYRFSRPHHAKTATYPRNYAIVALLLTTDLCNTELLHLTPADLRWDEGEIFVKCGRGKKFRRMAFSDLAQSAVRLYLASGLRPKDLPNTAPLFGTTSEKGTFGAKKRDCSWSAGSSTWLSALVERHVKAVTGVPDVRCRELRYAAVQAESASLAKARTHQARQNVSLLERMKNRP